MHPTHQQGAGVIVCLVKQTHLSCDRVDDVRTHLKYYGAWTDTDDILDRVLKLNEANESADLISTPMTK